MPSASSPPALDTLAPHCSSCPPVLRSAGPPVRSTRRATTLAQDKGINVKPWRNTVAKRTVVLRLCFSCFASTDRRTGGDVEGGVGTAFTLLKPREPKEPS